MDNVKHIIEQPQANIYILLEIETPSKQINKGIPSRFTTGSNVST